MTPSRGLRAQVESLLADELWDSAETLGGLLASHAQSRHADAEGLPAGERAACVALFADALLGKREHRRALHHYASALELNRLAPLAGGQSEAETPTPMGTRPPGTPGPDGSPAAPAAPVTPGAAAALATRPRRRRRRARRPRARARFRRGAPGRVLHGSRWASVSPRSGRWRSLAELETIPARARTLPVTLALAEAYKRTGYDRASVACYKECLRINPFAVEAAEALADAGAAPAEPPEDETENAADAFASNARETSHAGRVALASGDAATAASAPPPRGARRTFPGDARVELARARARRRRATTPPPPTPSAGGARPTPAAEGADEFAELLRRRADEGEGVDFTSSVEAFAASAHDADDEHGLGGYGVLSCAYGLGGAVARGASGGELRELVSEALEAAPERPEPWGAAAAYWAARGQVSRALGVRGQGAAPGRSARRRARRARAPVSASAPAGRRRRVVPSRRRALQFNDARLHARARAGVCHPFCHPGRRSRRAPAICKLQRRRKEALAAAKEALALAPGSALARALAGDAYLARAAHRERALRRLGVRGRQGARGEGAEALPGGACPAPRGLAARARASEAQRVCGEPAAAIQTLRAHLAAYAAAETRARGVPLRVGRGRRARACWRMPRASTSARVAWTPRASPRSGVWRASSV